MEMLIDIVAGLFAASGIVAAVVGSSLVLGRMMTTDVEQRDAVVLRRVVALPERYARLARGSRTSRTPSPSTLTARIRLKSAADAASRFHHTIGSRASSSRA